MTEDSIIDSGEDVPLAMLVGRIHYVLGAYFIGVGALYLVGLIDLLSRGPSELTVAVILWALAVGMIPFGVYYLLSVRRRRGLVGVT